MKQTPAFMKVTKGMFSVQFSWTMWFLAIMLGVNILNIIKVIYQGGGVDDYYLSVYIAANIYMFIIGLIAVYFLPHFVDKGVTRKAAFKGTILAAGGLSVVIPILSYVLSAIVTFIVKMIADVNFHIPNLNEVIFKAEGHIIGDLIQIIVLSPYVEPQTSWLISILLFSFNIFIYYVIGLFISVSFYRFGPTIGLGAIGLSVIFLILEDTLLRISLHLPVFKRFAMFENLPYLIAILLTIAVVVLIIGLIRLISKRAPIKI